MGRLIFFKRGSDDYREYKQALMMAKKSIERLCELTEEMEDEYGYEERSGGYRMRYGERREDWDGGMDERRSRDSRGRYM